MKHIDEAAVTNSKFWEEEVKKGGGHTIPWLDLDLDQLHRYIRGELGNERLLGRKEPRRFLNMSPESISVLGDMDDIFNGLSDNGLLLLRVDDRARYSKPAPDARPGSYSHESAYIGGGFTILARREKNE